MSYSGGRPFTRTTSDGAGDFFDLGANAAGQVFTVCGIRLTAGSGAAAAATVVDGDAKILAELTALQGTTDTVDIPILAARKVNLSAITGAGASVTVYIK